MAMAGRILVLGHFPLDVFRLTAAPSCRDDYGTGRIELFDNSDGPLEDGTCGKRPLISNLREFSFADLIAEGGALDRSVQRAITRRPERVIVLSNGFEYEATVGKYPAGEPQPNPHNAIFHESDVDRPLREHKFHETPWLKRLRATDAGDVGVGENDLVIAFATSTDPGGVATKLRGRGRWNSFRRHHRRLMGQVQWNGAYENTFAHAYDLAAHYALALAAVLAIIDRRFDGPPVSFLAHSLGTRVITAALRRLCREYGDGAGQTHAIDHVDRVILLASALSQHQVAGLAKDKWSIEEKRAPKIEMFNFTSSQDLILSYIGAPLAADIGIRVEAQGADPDLACVQDAVKRHLEKPERAFLLLWRHWRAFKKGKTLDHVVGVHGAGTAGEWLNWIDIPLDHPQVRAWGELAGLRLAGDLKECMMDHWVHYTFRPNWRLYRRILFQQDTWTIEKIRGGLARESERRLPPLTARPSEFYKPIIVTGDPKREESEVLSEAETDAQIIKEAEVE